MTRQLIYGTCVALGAHAALLRGGSGTGKSDLALRFLALPEDQTHPARLVADDQIFAEATERGVVVSPPETLAGLIEVRGLGICPVPYVASARLTLVCDLVEADAVPRMPPEPWDRTTLAGIGLPTVKLAPFEASAPLKLKMALSGAAAHLRANEQ